jgi:DNA-binding response OmpR family regulator
MRLLLIEDDPQLGKALYQGLKEEYTTDWFQNAEEGAAVIDEAPYDVIVLDINLPGVSGLDWLRELRNQSIQIPVLLLTARDAPSQRVEGLDAGADDYLIKPFDFDELLARIRALLRRKGTYQETVIHYKNIEMDLAGKTVSKDGEIVAMSGKEFETLRLLMENVGRCLSKEQIQQKIYSWDDEFESNTVEVYISSIRRKLGKDLIKTMRGIGYIMVREV